MNTAISQFFIVEVCLFCPLISEFFNICNFSSFFFAAAGGSLGWAASIIRLFSIRFSLRRCAIIFFVSFIILLRTSIGLVLDTL